MTKFTVVTTVSIENAVAVLECLQELFVRKFDFSVSESNPDLLHIVAVGNVPQADIINMKWFALGVTKGLNRAANRS